MELALLHLYTNGTYKYKPGFMVVGFVPSHTTDKDKAMCGDMW